MLAKLKDFLQQQFSLAESDTAANPDHALQLATAALAIEIARADSEVSDDERSNMATLLTRHYDLTAAEVEKLMALAGNQLDESVSLYKFTRELNDGLEREERIAIISLLWQVAWADRHLDKYEEHYIRKIADLLYVSHSDYIRVKLEAEAGAKQSQT